MKIPLYRHFCPIPDVTSTRGNPCWPMPQYSFEPEEMKGYHSSPVPWTHLEVPDGSRIARGPIMDDDVFVGEDELRILLPDGEILDELHAFWRFGEPDVKASEWGVVRMVLATTEPDPQAN